MARTLFRDQAIQHAVRRSYGEILLTRPITYSFLTFFFGLIAVGLVAFFACFSYTRKAQVPGVLLPKQGLIRVLSPQAGIVTDRRVAEGQLVRAGDMLFVLTNERADAKGTAEQTITALLRSRKDSFVGELSQLRRQSAQRIDAAARRIDELYAEMRRLDEQMSRQRSRVELAEATLKRYEDLQASNFVSPALVQEKRAELIDQQQRLAEIDRARAGAGRDRGTAQAERRDLEVQAQRDHQSAQRNVAAIEQEVTENEARREVFVRAPQDGIVSAITVQPGQSVAAGYAIATVLPAGSELEAELYAPSRAAGFVRPGMTVQLRYQGYAYQKFGQPIGEIREISRTAMRTDELSLPGAALGAGPSSEPLYRIRVTLQKQTITAYGVDQALKPGEGLDASILLERRRLYEWVLEPLQTIAGRI